MRGRAFSCGFEWNRSNVTSERKWGVYAPYSRIARAANEASGFLPEGLSVFAFPHSFFLLFPRGASLRAVPQAKAFMQIAVSPSEAGKCLPSRVQCCEAGNCCPNNLTKLPCLTELLTRVHRERDERNWRILLRGVTHTGGVMHQENGVARA